MYTSEDLIPVFPVTRPRPYLIKGQPAQPEEVIRIKMFEEPTYEKTEDMKWEWTSLGSFEWSYLKDKYVVNMYDLKKEIDNTSFAGQYDKILTRLINFRKAFLVIPTGEIVTTF
jgi:hypothetical protein